MKNGIITKILGLVVSITILASVAGCSGNNGHQANGGTSAISSSAGTEKNDGNASTEPVLEYSFFKHDVTAPAFANEADDVVTPIIEQKFNIKVKDVMYLQSSMTLQERMNLFIASNELPDVVMTNGDNITLPQTGRYAELGDLIKENCPNLMKFYPEDMWKDTLYNGKMYVFPSLLLDDNTEQFKDDPYVWPAPNWAAIYTKESVLKKLGYKFTPVKEIMAKFNETQVKPSRSEFQVEPAINTPEDFYNFLKKIKETIPKVNGKDIIPFTMPIWLEPQLGAMFGLTGGWKYNPNTKKVSQSLGDEHAKEYWQFVNKLYNEGLLDKDFAIQKDEQIQEKCVQGRVASTMWLPDPANVEAAMKKEDATDSLHAIPLPLQPGCDFVGIDGVSKATYKWFISKDVKDIPRLLRYFDWFQSAEAYDLYTWGPEKLGLWEMKDGKKVWKDEKFHSIISGEQNIDDPNYLKTHYYKYGLGSTGSWPNSKAFASVPMLTVNLADWRRSYPFKVDNSFWFQQCFVGGAGVDWNGYIGCWVNDQTKQPVDYTYGEFEQQQSAKLFAAKSTADFDKSWDEIMKYLNDKLKYQEAKKTMELEYKKKGFDVVQ